MWHNRVVTFQLHDRQDVTFCDVGLTFSPLRVLSPKRLLILLLRLKPGYFSLRTATVGRVKWMQSARCFDFLLELYSILTRWCALQNGGLVNDTTKVCFLLVKLTHLTFIIIWIMARSFLPNGHIHLQHATVTQSVAWSECVLLTRSYIVVSVHRVQGNVVYLIFVHNFCKCRLIFKIFSLSTCHREFISLELHCYTTFWDLKK